jgi:CO dehydrogenase/acetyl-CoA synthase gamma subunit (corrinoid Fe-S protein)
MITADLYLNKIDFLKYLPMTDCKDCGEPSCTIFVKGLKSGTQTPEKCPFLQDSQILAFQLALNGDRILPKVPALDLPRPATTGLTQINGADESSLVLLSGNSEFTQEVITTMMGFTLSPFWLLFVDCRGDTVDMAMVYQSLKVEKIITTLEESGLDQGQARRKIILPGFASRLKEPVERQTGWQVRVGPLCIAELPLFLGNDWKVPPDLDLG